MTQKKVVLARHTQRKSRARYKEKGRVGQYREITSGIAVPSAPRSVSGNARRNREQVPSRHPGGLHDLAARDLVSLSVKHPARVSKCSDTAATLLVDCLRLVDRLRMDTSQQDHRDKDECGSH